MLVDYVQELYASLRKTNVFNTCYLVVIRGERCVSDNLALPVQRQQTGVLSRGSISLDTATLLGR